jgi:hypothetical protein
MLLHLCETPPNPYSSRVQGKLLKYCLETTVRYDNIYKKGTWQFQNILHLGRRPPGFWGTMIQPAKPIGKSGTDGAIPRPYCFVLCNINLPPYIYNYITFLPTRCIVPVMNIAKILFTWRFVNSICDNKCHDIRPQS